MPPSSLCRPTRKPLPSSCRRSFDESPQLSNSLTPCFQKLEANSLNSKQKPLEFLLSNLVAKSLRRDNNAGREEFAAHAPQTPPYMRDDKRPPHSLLCRVALENPDASHVDTQSKLLSKAAPQQCDQAPCGTGMAYLAATNGRVFSITNCEPPRPLSAMTGPYLSRELQVPTLSSLEANCAALTMCEPCFPSVAEHGPDPQGSGIGTNSVMHNACIPGRVNAITNCEPPRPPSAITGPCVSREHTSCSCAAV